MIEIMSNNHFDTILDLFDGAENEIKIISPFLTMSMVEKLCEIVKGKHLSCTFITRFYMEDFLAKANSLDALKLMLHNGIEVLLLKRLHTKLYLFGKDRAVLGSANFTNGGFKSNIELSLLLSEENKVLSELHSYFDTLAADVRKAEEGYLTQGHIDKAKEAYALAFSSKKNTSAGKTWNAFMIGAALTSRDELKNTNDVIKELEACESEQKDIITALFKESEKAEQIKYPYNIWLKFIGEADDRYHPDERYEAHMVLIEGRPVHVSNYPVKPSSVRGGDEIYLACLTTDKKGRNQPVIVGRGHLRGFADSNHVSDEMSAKHEWMERFPWYCEVTDCEILDTSVSNGIPLDIIWDALGSDTYLASFGRNEDIQAVSRKHYQKAHIRLSGNAKMFVDKRFDALVEQYGVIKL